MPDERRERDEIEEYELELEEFAAAGGGDTSVLRAADDAMKTASARMAARRDWASGGGGVVESLDRMEFDTRHVIKSHPDIVESPRRYLRSSDAS